MSLEGEIEEKNGKNVAKDKPMREVEGEVEPNDLKKKKIILVINVAHVNCKNYSAQNIFMVPQYSR